MIAYIIIVKSSCQTSVIQYLWLDSDWMSELVRSIAGRLSSKHDTTTHACCCLLHSSEPFHLMPNFGVTQWRN